MQVWTSYALLFAAGILAGVSNAIAGGGTFFTFPVFLATGIPPVVANASNAFAVWPGHALAVVGYRRELRKNSKGLAVSIVVAIIGGACGALMLRYIGNTHFIKLVPFLILFATVLFALGGRIKDALRINDLANQNPKRSLATRLGEFSFAVYGGFFGAGLGIMLMTGLYLLGVDDIQANNAKKNLLASFITSIAVCIFAFSNLISWSHTLIAFTGAVLGGLIGARAALWLPAVWLRRIVLTFGLFLTVYYFFKYY